MSLDRIPVLTAVLALAALAPAQELSLATKDRPAHTATGTVKALWITSLDETPLAKGTFTIRTDGERMQLEMKLTGIGHYVMTDDGKQGWSVDPAAGPALLEGDARRGQQRLLGVLAGARWKRAYDSAGAHGSGEDKGVAFEMLPKIEGAKKADLWVPTADGKALKRSRMSMVDGLGELHEVVLRLEGSPGKLGVPAKMAIERGHHSFELTVEKVVAGGGKAADYAMPDDMRQAAELFAGGADDLRKAQIQIVQVQEVHVASIRRKVKMADLGRVLGGIYSEVMTQVRKEGVSMIGAPFSRYHTQPGADGTVDLEAGIPVSRPIEGNDTVQPRKLPAGRVASTWHVGPYHELGKTYTRVFAWLGTKKLETRAAGWEIYWTDPGMQPDPSRWRTQVVLPVR